MRTPSLAATTPQTLADLIGDTPAAVTIMVGWRVVYANAAAGHV